MAKFLCCKISLEGIQGSACNSSDLFAFHRKVFLILVTGTSTGN